MNKALIIILCNIALYGCAHAYPDNTAQTETHAAETQARTFVYECPDDFSFVARTETGKIWLFLPGKTLDLPQVPSASGTKYSNGIDTFWSKADEALVETGDDRHAGCRNNHARAIWEHAKLNGVDFRAIGNEPGWHMEPHSRIAIYSASNDDSIIEVVIKGDPCRDSMSGEAFAATVSVVVDDRRYTGCGKALH